MSKIKNMIQMTESEYIPYSEEWQKEMMMRKNYITVIGKDALHYFM